VTDFSRASQIFEAFKRVHATNPEIWKLFERFTLLSVARGRRYYPCTAVYERILWHVDIETTGEPVKLNNNYSAYYARMFEAKHPEHPGFFRKRRRTSEEKPAYVNDMLVAGFVPADGEYSLMKELERL